MEERFTVQLAMSTPPDKMESLAERLAEAFLLTKEEAQALLSADTLVLTRTEALALVKMCRQSGVEVSLGAPLLTPAVHTQRWLKRFTLPIVFSLSSVLALVMLILWIVPNGAPQRVSKPEASDKGDLVALPWVESADPAESADSEIISEIIVVEPYTATPEISLTEAVEDADIDIVSVEFDSAAQDDTLAEPDLFSAARDLSGSQLEAVLDRSPNLELRDAYGQTPLMYAAGSNTSDSVSKLLFAGANPDALSEARWTPLMYAARNLEHPEVITVLLAAGADPSLVNTDGQTAKAIALAHDHIEAVAKLETILAESLEPQASDVPAESQVSDAPTISVTSDVAPEARQQVAASRSPANSVIPVIDSVAAPSATTGGLVSDATVDPALLVFEREGGSVNADESRNVILDCLKDWANCEED